MSEITAAAPVGIGTSPHETELIFGLAGPVGADLSAVSRTLADSLRKNGYEVDEIRVSTLIREIASREPLTYNGSALQLREAPEEKRLETYMDAGNAIRRRLKDNAALGLAAIAEIRGRRNASGGTPSRRAYIVRSPKTPEEVNLFRRVYGPGFFLIGVNANRSGRERTLAKAFATGHGESEQSANYPTYLQLAKQLMKRDEDEEWDDYGQRLRDVFQLADLFLDEGSGSSVFGQLDRFVRLILGDLGETPTTDEQFMFHAFAASWASGALGRQVGAVLVAPTREVIGIGWNDVPRGGGGLYRSNDHFDERDIRRARDSTNEHADEILKEITQALRDAGVLGENELPTLDAARAVFKKSRVMSLIEFGRTTHAEMEAILAAARIGAGVRDTVLYTTTFPCHECARLIVTAGVSRVVFVEPYPKSRALELHADAMVAYDDDREVNCKSERCNERHFVRLEPFVGVGPNRFRDLFSITTSAGIRLERKTKSGERLDWDRSTSFPKVEMIPMSYLDLEWNAISRLERILNPPSADQP